ncbi:hypothetical protein COCOBI_01-1010 [Coccomyxa sp. Obi]|nr:hypothetical protein COCOBI_01-1010 [Coccomyxa sp. Obi]
MTVYRCKCGFESSAAPAFHKHLTSFKGKSLDHYMLTMEQAKETERAASQVSDDIPSSSPLSTPGASPPNPPQSYLSGLPSRLGAFWSSPEAGPSVTQRGSDLVEGSGRPDLVEQGTEEEDGRPLGGASSLDSLESLVRVSKDLSRRESDISVARQSDVDAAWETVAALAPDEGEADSYRAITKQLQAVGGEGTDPPAARSGGARGDTAAAASPPGRLGATFSRTLGVFGWGGSKDVGPASSQAIAIHKQIPVERVEALLLWSDPYATAKVFGGGLYVLICLRHLVCGVELLQPSSAVAGAALFALLYSALARAWSARRPLPRRVAGRVRDAADAVAPYIAAVAALVTRRLSGHDSVGATVWLALVLWLVMCVGELGVVSQSVLAMYAWIALFLLPYFYRACRHALDALVEETLLFVAEVIRGGERMTLGMAGGVAVLLVGAVDASVFARLTLAAAGAGGVLIWRARQLRAQAQTSLKSYPITLED